MKHAAVLGTGSCLPERVLTNYDLEKLVETSDEWITSRTGIQGRRIAVKGEETFKLASVAARRALESAKLKAEELDLIVVATITPHKIMPSCACFVQAEIGATNAFAYDLNAACSGFLYGLDLADKYILSKPDMKILLIGAENLSSRVNWQDRNTCILFGDGAGACILSSRTSGKGVIDSNLFSDGTLWKLLHMDSPKSLNKDLVQEDAKGCFIQMSGQDVFKYAVRAMEDAVSGLLDRHSINVNDITMLIPHQANVRILNKLMDRLGFNKEKVFVNVNKYGNTSAASIPIALDEASRQGVIKHDDLLLFCSFGGGFTWGALLMHW